MPLNLSPIPVAFSRLFPLLLTGVGALQAGQQPFLALLAQRGSLPCMDRACGRENFQTWLYKHLFLSDKWGLVCDLTWETLGASRSSGHSAYGSSVQATKRPETQECAAPLSASLHPSYASLHLDFCRNQTWTGTQILYMILVMNPAVWLCVLL